MKILSLFDGISCARVALEKSSFKVKEYYSSEIDKYAIQIAQKNYPTTIQLGDIKNIRGCRENNFSGKGRLHRVPYCEDIDLLIGGSPCQDLSIAKKNREGLDGKRSGLFWEYVRILKEVKPKYFILENVNSMPKEARDLITKTLGVEPIMINAALVSAQNRKRLFWFGQIRERLYFEDVYCYNCLYENSRIQKETSGKGEGEILGNPQNRQGDLQGVSVGVPENNSQRDNKNLLSEMPTTQQKRKRQETQQTGESIVSTGIPKKEQNEIIGVSENVPAIGSRQRKNERGGFTTLQENSKSDEATLFATDNGNKKENDERGSDGDIGNEKNMCCVQCKREINNRPHTTFITGRNERFTEPTNTLSALQFSEARQNNGRILDVYQVPITQPEDKGILLKDILQPDGEVDERMVVNGKSFSVTASYNGAVEWNLVERKQRTMVRVAQFGKGGQGDRIYSPNGKSVGLSALGGGRGAKTGLYAIPVALRNRGNGKKPEYNGTQKANSMTTVQTDSMVEIESSIRKLTPVECERLQGLPDNYTAGVSNSQRYKMLGNAFNVDVVAHILRHIK